MASYGANPIGKRGRNPGPSATSAVGARATGNLGRTTSVRKGATQNRDTAVAFKRRGINQGPGGEQRP